MKKVLVRRIFGSRRGDRQVNSSSKFLTIPYVFVYVFYLENQLLHWKAEAAIREQEVPKRREKTDLHKPVLLSDMVKLIFIVNKQQTFISCTEKTDKS